MKKTINHPATQASSRPRLLTGIPMKKLCLLSMLAVAIGCNTDKFTGIPTASNFYFVRLTPEAASIAVGQTQQLTLTAFDAGPCSGAPCSPLTPGNPVTVDGVQTFRSTDTLRVKVSSTGLVTGIGVGTASVIATQANQAGSTNGTSVTLADTTVFTVTPTPVALGSLQLAGRATGTPNTIGAGSALPLVTTITSSSGAAVTTVGRPQYYSTRPDVATVNSSGVVSGLNPGTTTILATITVAGVTKTTAYDVVVTLPVAGTVQICGQACQTPVVPGTGIAFTPATITVSATQAKVQGLAGATVVFTVPNNTFTATTTPNNTACFNVTFANPGAAGAVAPSTDSGNIGTGSGTNAPLCSASSGVAVSRSRLFTTPGTYTYTNTTNGATGTIIVV